MDDKVSLIDLKAISKPACKLIETVGNAVGVVYEPTRIRRKAKADAEAMRILAEGRGDAAEIEARAAARLEYVELRRQRNIESVVREAVEFLPDAVSEDKVSDDWVAQFFECCQDVGDENLRIVWARLLAGEVANPGSFSPRTLNALRLMRKDDASIFAKFSNYLWLDLKSGFYVHLHANETAKVLEEKGILYAHLLHLEAIGLLQLGDIGYQLDNDNPIAFEYGGIRYDFHRKQPHPPVVVVRQYPITVVGCELVRLCDRTPDSAYLEAFLGSGYPGGSLEWSEQHGGQ